MNGLEKMMRAASIASQAKEAIELLLQKEITSSHTMRACVAIVEEVHDSEEAHELIEAMLIDVINRMGRGLDDAIVNVKKEEKKNKAFLYIKKKEHETNRRTIYKRLFEHWLPRMD